MSRREPTERHDFAEVCRARNHAELALIRVELRQAGIRHFVQNEFAAMGAVAGIGAEQLVVMVEAARQREAAELIRAVVR